MAGHHALWSPYLRDGDGTGTVSCRLRFHPQEDSIRLGAATGGCTQEEMRPRRQGQGDAWV